MSYYGKFKSNFDIFMEILEKERNSIKKNEDDSYQDQIVHAIEAILDLYSCVGPQKDGETVTFSLPEFRCAYLYLYATSHVRLVCSVLNDLRPPLLRAMQFKSELRVCSIGGGPGTDFIGLLMFMQDNCPEILQLNGCVLDIAPEWKSVYYKMKKQFDPNNMYLGDIRYYQFDLFKDCDKKVEEELSICDLVIMIKFVSAVDSHYNCENRLKNILEKLKPGALLVFVDNGGGGSQQLLSRAARQSGLEELFMIPRKQFLLAEYENTSSVRSRLSEFSNICPQTSTIVSYGLWQKQNNENWMPRNMKITVKYSCSNSIRLDTVSSNRNFTKHGFDNISPYYSDSFSESSGYSSFEESPFYNGNSNFTMHGPQRNMFPNPPLNNSSYPSFERSPFFNKNNYNSHLPETRTVLLSSPLGNNYFNNYSPGNNCDNSFNNNSYTSYEESPQYFDNRNSVFRASCFSPYRPNFMYGNSDLYGSPSLNSSFSEYLNYHNFQNNQNNVNTSICSQKGKKHCKRKFMSPIISTKVKRPKFSPMPYSKRRRVLCPSVSHN